MLHSLPLSTLFSLFSAVGSQAGAARNQADGDVVPDSTQMRGKGGKSATSWTLMAISLQIAETVSEWQT
jgi:hypothetical protein